MWTLKTQSTTRLEIEEIKAHNNGQAVARVPGLKQFRDQGRAIEIGQIFNIFLTFTVTDGTKDLTVSAFVEDEDVAIRTMRDKLDKMNKQEAFMAAANDPTWTLPEPEAPPEKTDLEKKKELYEAERAELLKLKEDVELGLADRNDVTNKTNAVRNARTEYENARRNA